MQTVKLGSAWNFDSARKQEKSQPRAQFGGGWIAPPTVKEHVRQAQEKAERRAQFGAGWIAPPHVKEHIRRTQPK